MTMLQTTQVAEVKMSPIPEEEPEAVRQERTIHALKLGANASLEHVRGLFVNEFARLRHGAKVRKFVHVLTTSNVRAMLRRLNKASRP